MQKELCENLFNFFCKFTKCTSAPNNVYDFSELYVRVILVVRGTSHKYVALNTSVPILWNFGKLRQGSGGTYSITVQHVIEKTNIHKASLLLSLNRTEELNVMDGLDCPSCGLMLDEEGAEVFDIIQELEDSIPLETKMALVYISEYVTSKDPELSEKDVSRTTIKSLVITWIKLIGVYCIYHLMFLANGPFSATSCFIL